MGIRAIIKRIGRVMAADGDMTAGVREARRDLAKQAQKNLESANRVERAMESLNEDLAEMAEALQMAAAKCSDVGRPRGRAGGGPV